MWVWNLTGTAVGIALAAWLLGPKLTRWPKVLKVLAIVVVGSFSLMV